MDIYNIFLEYSYSFEVHFCRSIMLDLVNGVEHSLRQINVLLVNYYRDP